MKVTAISQFNHDDIDLKPVERAYDGFFKVNLYRFRHALFSGGESVEIKREILERGHAVAVLPYDPATDQILLVEQVRIGALASKQSPWLLECIAGMADGSTDYEQVAKREAWEEAGIELGELEFMMSYLSSPGGTTERLYLYLARADLSQYQEGIFGLDNEDEDIKTHVMSYTEAMLRLEQGEIDNAATVISLQWLALNKQRILSDWQTA
ncbi:MULTISPECIES: NUDIX domain-containing protein [Pseudoalteromonas]|uniref:NUDIX domain-containing protein n=1 Tax=Pseudoalteromonas TaxID=53246 RepID=UPI00078267E6|nr:MULTISPECIES: NUDIX domain-containing protein [Gammaproteobacteria]MCF7519867.1 NUDIX domain-containing protein [Pseudoalteromonas sp. L21]UJX26191.1 NUDIX domain-containing protein [Pseudoalteromonas sp. CF6-2]|tara:strand:+ start:151 stop:783 length:633 start_codon:yes stop_codon:yes gene_type:complete